MAILEKEVWIRPTINNKKHYINKGYVVPTYVDWDKIERISKKTSILVSVSDLHDSCTVKLTKVCDICKKKVPNQSYDSIRNSRVKGDGNDRCYECKNAIVGIRRKNNLKYNQSLEYYCNEEGKQHLLHEFSEKNNIVPSRIHKGTKDKYIWNCSKCKGEYTTSIDLRVRGSGCPYCSNTKVMRGFNDMWTTNPLLASMLVDLDDGYKYTQNSTTKLDWKCPSCRTIVKNKKVSDVNNKGLPCSKCSDGISYPERFMGNVLTHLNVLFIAEKVFDWSNGKRYDFHVPSLNMLIETHGKQHYEESNRGRTLKEEQENDGIKEELAKENGIENYVAIDCRHSDFNFIKTSIVNSELSNYFSFDRVDFELIHKESLKTNVVKACELYNKGLRLVDISNLLKVHIGTVTQYLKKGAQIKLCDYEPVLKEEKEIIQLSLEYTYIRTHINAKQAALETSIPQGNISRSCRNWTVKTAGGFKWMYKEEYINFQNTDSMMNHVDSMNKYVIQMSLEGKMIKKWKSVSEASKCTGVDSSAIHSVCKGKRTRTGEYIWLYLEEYNEEVVNNRLFKIKNSYKSKKVVQLSPNGNLVEEWNNMNTACKKLRLNVSKIYLACKGERKTAYGYRWMYKEDYDKYIEEKNNSLIHIV